MTDKQPRAPMLYTPVGVAHYPHLLEPDTKFVGSSGIPEFKCPLIIQPGPELDAFQAKAKEFFDAALASFLEANPKFKRTYKIKYEAFRPEVDEDGELTGAVKIVAKLKSLWKDKTTGKTAKQAPKIVDAKGKDCRPASIWGGSKVKLAVKPLFTNQGAEVTLAWRLFGVQIIELVKGGSGGGVAFGEADGYSADDDEDANFGAADETGGDATDEPSGDAGTDEEF